ncbi:MAG: rhodanese-like domain-containing protein [Acetobacteraceae bacterium]|nr:rhodanese-like domain-containing protein [Acetobacteraceae bacterium]MBV8523479.1 rhodanese-like domain-containing protein [Acetobacteraceae bacterium]
MVENVPPRQVWEALTSDPQAQLVDVRTDAEWNYVGLPDLSGAGKRPVLIPWQIYPTMQVNRSFIEQMQQAGLSPEHRIYFLCRSGVRSAAAAAMAKSAGFPDAYNIADGFEGPADREGHRGKLAGWKAERLPWRQA